MISAFLFVAFAAFAAPIASPPENTPATTAKNRTSDVWLSPLSDRVLVIYNGDLPASFEVASYYAKRRGIPPDHLLGIHPTSIAGYQDNYLYSLALTEVVAPITNALTRIGSQKILYLVFTYGTPYSVFNDVWKYPRVDSIRGASLDSYLSDPFGEAFAGKNLGAAQKTRFYANPYSPGTNATPNAVPGGIDGPVNALDPDTGNTVVTGPVTYPPYESLAAFRARTGKRVYAVFRLDAATPAIAKQQVDKAIQAEQAGGLDHLGGTFYFDRKSTDDSLQTPPPTGPWIYDRYVEWTLLRTRLLAASVGLPWQEENTAQRIGDPQAQIVSAPRAAFYAGTYGWYNTDAEDGSLQPDPWTWLPGAIGIEWKSEGLYGGPRGDNNPPNGKDLDTGWGTGAIAAGITATLGGIAEPLDEGVPRTDAILRNLLEGANIGDAFFRDAWYLGWQILNVGDPLYAPFPGGRAPYTGTNKAPPQIFLIQPEADATFVPPATIRLEAVIQSTNQPPARVEFFLGTNSVIVLTPPPYIFTLTNLDLSPGAYAFTATFTDGNGNISTSAPVSFTMTAHNQATEFEIFASDLAPLISSPLTLTAWFHSTDNNLNPVEFFAGTNLLGRADAAPFSVTIGTLPPEEVVLSARTRDLSGHDQFSQPLALTAQAPHIDDLLFGALQVQLQVSLVGIGTTNIIQTSTNLVDWFPIGTNRAAANQFQFVDPDAHQLEQRFYRIAEPR